MADPTDVTLSAYESEVGAYLAASPGSVPASLVQLLEALVAAVPQGAEVLEIGSGPGREAVFLEQRGLVVHRSDATPAFVTRLREQGHEARVLDVRRDELGGPYDAVLANAVLLHLDRSDVEQVLTRLREATRPGGLLALTLKEGDGEAWSTAKLGRPRWFVYWREDDLRTVLARAGWAVVDLQHVEGRHEPWLYALARC